MSACVGNAAHGAAKEPPLVRGYLHTIKVPITDAVVNRADRFVKNAIRDAKKKDAAAKISPPSPITMIFQFVPTVDVRESEANLQAVLGKYTPALDVANLFTKELANVKTVAYIPQACPGHAVLSVLACEQIFLAPEASLGPVLAQPQELNDATLKAAYRDIPARRGPVSRSLASWMLNPELDVKLVKTSNSGASVADAEAIAELSKNATILEEIPLGEIAKGAPGEILGEEARSNDLFIRGATPSSPGEMVQLLGLNPTILREDIAMVLEDDKIKPAMISIRGVMTDKKASKYIRQIGNQVTEDGVNLLVIWIDSPGGDAMGSLQLANYLTNDLGDEVKTVAYIPGEALSDAALIATACDEIFVTPETVLGGGGAETFSKETLTAVEKTVLDTSGAWKLRPQALVAATVCPGMEVYRCTRGGEVAYLSDAMITKEKELHPAAKDWNKGEVISPKGKELSVRGERIVQLGLADQQVASFEEAIEQCGLADAPRIIEPNWVDDFVEKLASLGGGALLFLIAMIAIKIELSAPGIGLGGFVALLCFILFFWAHFLDGTAGWLEVVLFIGGLGCLLIEIFLLPGFGIFGVGGAIMLLLSVIFATQTHIGLPTNEYQTRQFARWVGMFAGVGVTSFAIALLLNKFLPKTPGLRSKIFLGAPEVHEVAQYEKKAGGFEFDELFGKQGETTTELMPSGKAIFDGKIVAVLTAGDVIEEGVTVEVYKVQRNRVFVREV